MQLAVRNISQIINSATYLNETILRDVHMKEKLKRASL